MAVTVSFFNRAFTNFATAVVNLDTDDLKIILMGTGYTFNKDTQHLYADISADELPGSPAYGYTQKAEQLTGTTITEDDAGDQATFTCDDPEWTASGGAIGATKGAIILSDTAADDPLIAYIDFGGNITVPDGSSLLLQDIVFNMKQGT